MEQKLKEIDDILVKFEKNYWVAPSTRKGKMRHILLHMTKLVGKLGAVIEKWEHGFEADESVITEEVIPDLLMYALMLSREENEDLGTLFLDRLEMNKEKVGKWKGAGIVRKLPQF